MADKRIDQLTAATSLTAVDLMVTEQSGVAKRVTGDILANSAWNMMQKDASPTKDSTAPVTSGAVYDALGGVFSPTKLATPGALVHIEDGAYNQPIQGMKIAINPVQSGSNPSPENPCPISGWNAAEIARVGKNLLKNTSASVTKQGLTYTVNADGTVTVSGTATANSYLAIACSLMFETPSIVSGVPTPLKSGVYIQVVAGGSNYSDTTGNGVTIPANTEITAVRMRIDNGVTVSNVVFKPMVRLAYDTDKTYEPYKGEVYEVSFGAAGTVYGGTLTYNGDGTWTLAVETANIASYNGETLPGKWISSMDVYAPGTTPTVGAQVVYELASPQNYTLTGPEVLTLLGINNIWADCGEIEELAYRADIGLYLVEALNPIKEMLAYREDTMRATRAYTAGDFIVVGDAFYKAAVPIANGATLTPNTNVIKTTVGDQLKALS